MNIVFLGSGRFAIESLNALLDSMHNLRLIITQPAQRAGRGRQNRLTPVAAWAEGKAVPCIEAENINNDGLIERIRQFEPDVVVVAAFGQIIGNDLIALPSKAIINIHASLLPKYRGAGPINWAIINGENKTGVSIITVVKKMDAGDILAQKETDIEPDETAGQLHDKLAEIAAPLLLETLNQISAGTATYTPQDHSKATFAPKLKKSDGFLDFVEPAEVLHRKIRGFWPWPGASATYLSTKTKKPQRVTIATAKVVAAANQTGRPPGTLDNNLNVTCGQGSLKITQIKPAGSSLMSFDAFVNGRLTQPGDTFIRITDKPEHA